MLLLPGSLLAGARQLKAKDSAKTDFYDIRSNGTVRDEVTGLLWQQENDGNKRNWEEAKAYCANLKLAGATWRLPEDKELSVLLELRKQGNLYLSQVAFNHQGEGSWYWSTTPHAYIQSYAWYVDFESGGLFRSEQSARLHVRCVQTESGAR